MAVSRAVLVTLIVGLVLSSSSTSPLLHADAAISCGMVLSRLSSCFGYLRNGGSVPVSCCDAVSSFNRATATTPDARAACQCIKSSVPTIGAKAGFINSLPGICHVNIPFKYSPSLDCSKIVRV